MTSSFSLNPVAVEAAARACNTTLLTGLGYGLNKKTLTGLAEAARLFRRAEEAHDSSTLPVRPNSEKVNNLCLQVVELVSLSVDI